MSIEKRHKVLSILAVIGIFTAFLVYKGWQAINQAGYEACVASLTDAVWRQPEAKEIAARKTGWTVLSEDQIDRIIKGAKAGDCSPSADLRFDLQGNRIKIAVREEGRSNWPPIIVWSNGPDGMEGTDDDVIMPYGQKIPK